MKEEILNFFFWGTDAWALRSRNDQEVKTAEAGFDAIMEKIKPRLTEAEYVELSDAGSATAAAYGEAGFLYGLYIASQIQGLINNPYDR